MFLTYDISRRVPAHIIQPQNHPIPSTMAYWGQFCKQAMLVYLEGCSERIGRPNKTVEIDECKLGRLVYHRGHSFKGQWVFVGVERETVNRFSFSPRIEPLTL